MGGSAIVAVSGGSCSGKSSLAQAVATRFGEDACALMLQDDYYFTADASSNFDHPDAIDFLLLRDHLAAMKAGQAIDCPVYDFTTHTRTSRTRRIEPKPIILLDGILVLNDVGVRDVLDFAVFIECAVDLRLERRLRRDIAERGRTEESVIRQFNNQVEPMHARYVEPSKAFADLVLSGLEAPEKRARAINRVFSRCQAFLGSEVS